MLFAFLVLPHGSYFCPARTPLIEAGNGQSSRCFLFGSPAGSATAPPMHDPTPGAGGQSGFALFLAGLLHTRGRLAEKRSKRTNPPARGCHCCLIGGNLPMPPNPRWIVSVPDASRTGQPRNPCLHPPRKRPAFSPEITSFA